MSTEKPKQHPLADSHVIERLPFAPIIVLSGSTVVDLSPLTQGEIDYMAAGCAQALSVWSDDDPDEFNAKAPDWLNGVVSQEIDTMCEESLPGKYGKTIQLDPAMRAVIHKMVYEAAIVEYREEFLGVWPWPSAN